MEQEHTELLFWYKFTIRNRSGRIIFLGKEFDLCCENFCVLCFLLSVILDLLSYVLATNVTCHTLFLCSHQRYNSFHFHLKPKKYSSYPLHSNELLFTHSLWQSQPYRSIFNQITDVFGKLLVLYELQCIEGTFLTLPSKPKQSHQRFRHFPNPLAR